MIQPDASGGLGSLPTDLRSVLTRGLSLVIDGELSRRYGPGFFSDRVTVNTDGNVRPAAAPTTPSTPVDKAADALRNPYAIAALVAAGIVLAVVLVRRL